MKCTFSVSVCQSQIHLNSMAQQPDHKIIFMVLDYWYKSFSSSKAQHNLLGKVVAAMFVVDGQLSVLPLLVCRSSWRLAGFSCLPSCSSLRWSGTRFGSSVYCPPPKHHIQSSSWHSNKTFHKDDAVQNCDSEKRSY